MGSHFGIGEFTTHFRTNFRGDWNVHLGYGVLSHGQVSLPPSWWVKGTPKGIHTHENSRMRKGVAIQSSSPNNIPHPETLRKGEEMQTWFLLFLSSSFFLGGGVAKHGCPSGGVIKNKMIASPGNTKPWQCTTLYAKPVLSRTEPARPTEAPSSQIILWRPLPFLVAFQ